MDAPEELGGEEFLIGTLSTTSDLVTSHWGDAGLFFRHQDMAEDLALKPEWKPFAPYTTPPASSFIETVTGMAYDASTKFVGGCPFAYLWQ